MTITVHGVLAGAYKSEAKTLLTHASADGGESAICKRVKTGALCDLQETGEPSCPVCQAKLRRMQAPPKKSLAARARAKGFEPETPEGGRAMMQSLTMADIAGMKPRERGLAPGTEVTFEQHYVGGVVPGHGIVAWDNGRGKVDIAVKIGGDRRIVHAIKTTSGALVVYG